MDYVQFYLEELKAIVFAVAKWGLA